MNEQITSNKKQDFKIVFGIFFKISIMLIALFVIFTMVGAFTSVHI